MSFIQKMKELSTARPRNIIFPESEDDRVLEACQILLKEKYCHVSLIGNEDKLKSRGYLLDGASFFDPNDEDLIKEYTQSYYDLRKSKSVSWVEAKRALSKPINLASILLKHGKVDGLVSGSVSPTADVLRAGIQIVKPTPGNKTVSSFFVMIVPDKSFGEDGILFFADCGVVPNPTQEQLADIAVATAGNFEKLIGKDPRVGMLSFSTMGSASHGDVDKVKAALEIAKKKNAELQIDGEMQADAALIPAVGKKKAPDSSVAGNANILIFPTLDAGNIGYKLVQRLAKAEAYGPIIQGLSKPMNDLSRGCSVEDIVNVGVITSVQAI